MESVDDIEESSVLGFSSLETGSLESLRSMLCYSQKPVTTDGESNEHSSSYLELIQARHHYFSNANVTAKASTSDELTSILKDFEENFRLSNIDSLSDSKPKEQQVACSHSILSSDDINDKDILEEMELPPGVIADSSIGDITNGSFLQVDNFVDDESTFSPTCGTECHDITKEDEGVEEEEEYIYIPSFGVSSPPPPSSSMLNTTTNLTTDNHDGDVENTVGGGSSGSQTLNDGTNNNYTLDEMCELLKQDSDSDSDVESITDTYDSRPVHLDIPIQRMNMKLTTERKIRSDADVFLEHYINNMGTQQVDEEGAQSQRQEQEELVIDTANEINYVDEDEEEDAQVNSYNSNHSDEIKNKNTKNKNVISTSCAGDDEDSILVSSATAGGASSIMMGESDTDMIPLRAKKIMQEYFQTPSCNDDETNGEDIIAESGSGGDGGVHDRSYDDIEIFEN